MFTWIDRSSQENQLAGLRLKLSLLTGDIQTDQKQILEAKIAELSGDVEEKKKSAGALSSILKEAEVGRIAAATSCLPAGQALHGGSLPAERHPRSEEQDGEGREPQARPEQRGRGADAGL